MALLPHAIGPKCPGLPRDSRCEKRSILCEETFSLLPIQPPCLMGIVCTGFFGQWHRGKWNRCSYILWLLQRYSEHHQGTDSRSFSCKHLLWSSWHMGPSTALNSFQDMFNTQHIMCCRRLFSSHSSFFTCAVVTSPWSVKKHFSNILHHLVNTDHYTCNQDH